MTNNLNGFLVIDNPSNYTSRDVVNIVSKYSVKLSLEFINIFIRKPFFISANLITGFFYFLSTCKYDGRGPLYQ